MSTGLRRAGRTLLNPVEQTYTVPESREVTQNGCPEGPNPSVIASLRGKTFEFAGA